MRIPRRVPKTAISHLWERHREIARLLLGGMRQKDIADHLRMTYAQMSIICNSPVFLQYLARLRGRREDVAIDIEQQIRKGAEKGALLLAETVGNAEVPLKLRVQVAQDLLDREGHGKMSIQRNENVNVHLTSNRLEEIKKNREKLLSGMAPKRIEQKEESNAISQTLEAQLVPA